MTEIEPIGPLEVLKPKAKASFTEDWFIKDFQFPEDKKINPQDIRNTINQLD